MKKRTVVIAGMLGAAVGAGIVYRAESVKYSAAVEANRKDNVLLEVFSKWMRLKSEGKTIGGYLAKKGYQSVAIYGMHYLGECLLGELKGSGIEVRYAVDRNAASLYADVDILTLDDNIPEVDAVIVTAIWSFEEIKRSISEVVEYPVISLKDIIYDMESEK